LKTAQSSGSRGACHTTEQFSRIIDRRALAFEPNDDDEPDREPAAAPARNPVMVGSDSHDVIVENGRVVYVPRKLAW
jgi:hypothetical protein